MTERKRDLTLEERWSEDGQDAGYMGGTQALQCYSCVRRAKDGSLRCQAFPELGSIPVEISEGTFDHNRRHPDDNGLRRLHGIPSWDPPDPAPRAPWEGDGS